MPVPPVGLGIAACALVAASAAVAAKEAPTSLTIEDIVQTRQIDSLSVSPDGRWLAFREISRSVGANSVTGQWYRQDVSGHGPASPLGPAFTPISVPLMSVPKDGVSRWAPDSSALYVLSETGAGIQVHRLEPEGESLVTSDAADAETFDVSPDGSRLTYYVRDPRHEIGRKQMDENAKGIHFDRSIITDGLPLTENATIGGRVTTIRRVGDEVIGEAQRGELRSKTIDLPAANRSGPKPTKWRTAARNPSMQPFDAANSSAEVPLGEHGDHIVLRELEPSDPNGPFGRYRLEAKLHDGRSVLCQAKFCEGPPTAIRQVVASPRGAEAIVWSETRFRSRTTINAWNPRTGAVRTVRPESGSLDGGSLYSGRGCETVANSLLCVESGPTRPPRLVRIDMTSGKTKVLHDPNEDLAAKRFPETRVLEWRDKSGRPWNGVLVVPPGIGSRTVPLVITTYRCRGFLQGGTGWLAPEHILAQDGIAALCMNTNNDIFGQRDEAGQIATMQPYKDMIEALAGIIDQLSVEGLIDRRRVGISGHSFSANAATYAISHSDLFAAAVIGSGPTIDPGTYSIVAPAGDSWRKGVYDVIGLPRPSDDPNGKWQQTSPALNARTVTAPLLMQPPESEYLFCLQQYAFLQDAGKTVDMYVYPHEGHMASGQPVHQYWRNKRSVEWFGKWLRTPHQPQQR